MIGKSFKTVAVLFFLVLSGFRDSLPKLSLPKHKLNLCHISLNNKKEFELSKSFLEKIQERLGTKDYFNVTEFQEQGKSPEETFGKIVKSGHTCDGLVISGHHTGAFGGSRASGTLRIDTLEKLSCELENEPWFSKVNSLWLQGCRTLGAEKEGSNNNDNLAEYHAQRVARVRNDDGLNQTQTQLENEFASVLDSETPYATRFFKTFFNAKIYGWTMTAPGQNAQSEKSFLYHVSNVGRRLLLEDKMSIDSLENPTNEHIGEFAAATYFNALVTLLTPSNKKAEIVSSVEGWVDHGRRANADSKIYGFSNPELKAYPPLMVEGDKLAIRARQLDCNLRRAKQPREIENAVADVLATSESIAFSFYTIKEVLEEKMREVVTRQSVKRALARNKNLIDFLNLKINHKHVGVSKKLDYVGLYVLISGDRENSIIQKILREASIKLIAKTDPGNYDRRDEKQWILKSLIKNNLVTLETLLSWLDQAQDESFIEAISSSLSSITNDNINMDIARLTRILLANPKISMSARSSIVFALNQMTIEPDELSDIIRDYASLLVTSPGDDFNSLFAVLPYVKEYISGLEPILENIYSKIQKKEGTFITVINGVQTVIGNSDQALGAFIRVVCNPALRIKDWERYVLEVFEHYKRRNANLNINYHINPFVEALEMRDNLPPSMFPILKMISDAVDTYAADAGWQKVASIKLLSRFSDFAQVARAHKNQIIQSGNTTDINNLLYSSYSYVAENKNNSFLDFNDLEQIFNSTNDNNLRNSIIYSMGQLPKPNPRIAAFLRKQLESHGDGGNDSSFRAVLLLYLFAQELDVAIKRADFAREFIKKENLTYLDAAIAALIVVSQPDLIENPTGYLARLDRQQDFNPYLKGILVFHLVRQPSTEKVRNWMTRLLSAPDFTSESIGIVQGVKIFSDIFSGLTFKQLQTYFKLVGNHQAMERKTKFELRKEVRLNQKFSQQQKAELLALL
ncbi:MAG: hypothetical protein A4S09_16760 [Proteobacteria bacterium SG_bin7]|nr:MAG: hypothetical protein A4S09_16760 [Proteobacteria bacterium SG_bin7]